jgi:uncharacterized membrane protein
MDIKKYRKIRVLIMLFVAAIVAVAVFQNSYLLSLAGVLTGMLFMILVRTKTKIVIDEREKTIREKAAQLTYAVFAPLIGISSILLLLPSKSGLSVFSKGEWLYTESLGMLFAYLTLFLITVYAISYYFLNRKYGGGNEK